MKNHRLAVTLLALMAIASFVFTTGNPDSSANLYADDTQKNPADKASTIENPTNKNLPAHREIEVDSVQELMWTVDTCKDGNVTILIADGTYTIPNGLWITAENITYKSKSGDPNKVILQGDFKTSHIFWIASDHVTIQDISMGKVTDNGIQILADKDADYTLIKNVRFFDIKEHMIKASGSSNNTYSDYTRIEDCLFEYTSGNAYQSDSGGILVSNGTHWVIENNTFINIQTKKGNATDGAIYFKRNASDTKITHNTLIKCDRGILLGTENSSHVNGTITDNTIETSREAGIYLCNASATLIKNNVVTVPEFYSSGIEYLYNTEGTVIEQNTLNKSITSKNGGNAKVYNNVIQ